MSFYEILHQKKKILKIVKSQDDPTIFVIVRDQSLNVKSALK